MIFAAAFPVTLALVVTAIVVLCITIVIVLCWEKQPWWRKFPKPRKLVKDAKEAIKLSALQKQHPEIAVVPVQPTGPPRDIGVAVDLDHRVEVAVSDTVDH